MKKDRLERGVLNLKEIRAKLKEEERSLDGHNKWLTWASKKTAKQIESNKMARNYYSRRIGYWRWRERTYFNQFY